MTAHKFLENVLHNHNFSQMCHFQKKKQTAQSGINGLHCLFAERLCEKISRSRAY